MVDIAIPPTGDFLLLETINKDKTATRTIYVILPTPEKNILKLGRGHEADVRISDISVSRLHAQVKCLPDGYFLEDNHAKFGTLMLHRDPINLEPDMLRIFQVGRTMIHLIVSPATPSESEESSPKIPKAISNSTKEENEELPKPSSSNASQKPNQDGNQMEDVPDESEQH